jgi:hypothetical protein
LSVSFAVDGLGNRAHHVVEVWKSRADGGVDAVTQARLRGERRRRVAQVFHAAQRQSRNDVIAVDD